MECIMDIYETDELNKHRFALGSISEKTLFVFGINPSTADNKGPDSTVRKVTSFAEENGHTSFVMFNLYPQRATNPNDLPQEASKETIQKNVEITSKSISRQVTSDILSAWGGLFYSRAYFSDCLKQLYENLEQYPVNRLRIGEFSKSGQPQHSLYAAYSNQLKKMDMLNFLGKIQRSRLGTNIKYIQIA